MKKFLKGINWWILGYTVFATYMSIAWYTGFASLFFNGLFFWCVFNAGWFAKELELKIEADKTDAP
jgi:hypothetical protein